MAFYRKITSFLSFLLIILQLNCCFADVLTFNNKKIITHNLSPNSQINSLDSIFTVALQMANSGVNEEEIFSFLSDVNSDIIEVSIVENILSVQMVVEDGSAKLYTFPINAKALQFDKVYDIVTSSLRASLEIISKVTDSLQLSLSSMIKLSANTWKTFAFALLISFSVMFITPVSASANQTSALTAQEEVQKLAESLKIEASFQTPARAELEESFYKYSYDALKEISVALYYKNDEYSKEYGNTSAFKQAARDYANNRTQRNIDDLVKGLNWVIHDESKKFTMIAKVAKDFQIDPTLLQAIRVFETWDLSVGEKYTDSLKSDLTNATSIGAYQIRIDIMEKYLKSAYNDPDFISSNSVFFKKYPSYKDFLKVNGSIKSVLEADNEAAVELAIIFVKQHTEALKYAFPNIFEDNFSLKDCAIKDASIKNKFNIFFLAYTYDLIKHHKGDSMLDIFQNIKTNKPDLYFWMRVESKTLEFIQKVIHSNHNEEYSNINTLKGFNETDFFRISKDSVPAELAKKEISNYYIGIAFLASLIGGIYLLYRVFNKSYLSGGNNQAGNNSQRGNRFYNGKRKNNIQKIIDKIENMFSSKRGNRKKLPNETISFTKIFSLLAGVRTSKNRHTNDLTIVYSGKVALDIVPKNIKTLEGFLIYLNNKKSDFRARFTVVGSNLNPPLSEIYINVSSLRNKYKASSVMIYELYNLQQKFLVNGIVPFKFEPKAGMINLAFLDFIITVLHKHSNANLNQLGFKELAIIKEAA